MDPATGKYRIFALVPYNSSSCTRPRSTAEQVRGEEEEEGRRIEEEEATGRRRRSSS